MAELRPTPAAPRPGAAMLEQAKAYQVVKARLLGELGQRWPAGTRLPPIKQLAGQLQAGQTNTHLAVKELAREGLLISRTRQGTFVTERVSSLQNLAGGAAGAAGLSLRGKWAEIYPGSREPDLFLRRMIDACTQELAGRGCRVSVEFVESFHAARQAPPQRRPDAVVILNVDLNPQCTQPGQILCVLDTSPAVPVAQAQDFDVVSVDGEQGGLLAGAHLREIGCKSVCFLGCPVAAGGEGQYDLTSAQRLHGFEMGLQAAVPPAWRLFCSNYTTLAAAQVAPAFLRLDPRPQGIFAASDDLAIGLIHGLMAHGLRAGRDYQMVGFDGQQRGRELPEGALTTVEVPGEEMGRLAGRMLARRLAGERPLPRRVFLGCTLFQGKTTIPQGA